MIKTKTTCHTSGKLHRQKYTDVLEIMTFLLSLSCVETGPYNAPPICLELWAKWLTTNDIVLPYTYHKLQLLDKQFHKLVMSGDLRQLLPVVAGAGPVLLMTFTVQWKHDTLNRDWPSLTKTPSMYLAKRLTQEATFSLRRTPVFTDTIPRTRKESPYWDTRLAHSATLLVCVISTIRISDSSHVH